MKEYTVVTTIQFTEIIYSEDEFNQEKYTSSFLDELDDQCQYYFDKIDIKSCKVFPREVENGEQ